jgi:hypothetical protein
MYSERKEKYIPQLQTAVHSIAYDFDLRVGVIEMPAHYCCDMSGAIAYFKKIDPDVRQVQTYEARVADIVYTLTDEGEWLARMPLGAA